MFGFKIKGGFCAVEGFHSDGPGGAQGAVGFHLPRTGISCTCPPHILLQPHVLGKHCKELCWWGSVVWPTLLGGEWAWLESFLLCRSLPGAKVWLQWHLAAASPGPLECLQALPALGSCLWHSESSRNKVVGGPPLRDPSYFHGDKNKMLLLSFQGLSSLVWDKKEINFYRGEMEHRKSPTHLSASFGA